jgi:hypothetical protein
MQAVKATPGEPAPPLSDRLAAATQPRRDLVARLAISRGQHNPATQRQRLRALRAPSPTLKHIPVLNTEHDLCTRRHGGPQSSSITTNFAPNHPMPAN